ncbi:putative cytochrome P450 311a1 [Lucilia cuprina]|uniref:Putative cytochrome P450 311a1 n=1 Tax=Lucilia cuprina TaxID=7375 RepID=A0A0L0C380_LUCCU|nr:putative cytochrome P450 311a1 [Lucilia cuprina]KNC26785.1 putative cytochrome P450 311a1 [Lucilia cuprina]
MSVILVFCLVFASVHLFLKWYKVFLTGIQMPGPWAIPFMGNVQMITKLTPEKLLFHIQKFRETCGESFRLWLGPKLWVFLHTPEENRDALQDSSLRKADTFLLLDKLIGNGLLISHGKFWESHRKALGPAFHPNILNSFNETICQHADILVEILKSLQMQPVEITDYLFPCIMDAIIETSMGKNLQTQKDKNHFYTHAFHRTGELLFARMTNPLLFSDFIYNRTSACQELDKNLNIIHNLMESVIKERQEYLKEFKETGDLIEIVGKRKRPQCLLDTLLTVEIDEQPLTLKEIRDEVNTFVFAGVDTTTASMSFVLYALGKYPEEQKRLLQELQHHNLDFSESLTPSDLNKLEYLDMFIKECLRYYTIVPLTGRQTTQPTKIGQRTYAADITLWINMYGLAHDESLFEDAWSFKPSRFTKESYEKVPKFSYIPFSAGPHICIGRKYAFLIMKILTVKILQKLQVSLKDPEEELILMAQMVLKAKNGINLVFKERL